ncbi:hypothetical protein AVEN_129322-1 [Araneus ventricosus]|uniref:Uncharacterized protein n=1 Tax=Araneus ventricosus TaxID=182803 RepID=A0A4Y2T4G9_ARAVE|nr:hypothetical protein AVEN_129322-1 [Araneus ventricosus]
MEVALERQMGRQDVQCLCSGPTSSMAIWLLCILTIERGLTMVSCYTNSDFPDATAGTGDSIYSDCMEVALERQMGRQDVQCLCSGPKNSMAIWSLYTLRTERGLVMASCSKDYTRESSVLKFLSFVVFLDQSFKPYNGVVHFDDSFH